ncbi:MAG: hypothetical protein C4329_14335 [Chitinophagaceae bacterium]
MKKIAIVVTIAGAVFACSPKTAPTTSTTNTTNTTSTTSTSSNSTNTNSSASASTASTIEAGHVVYDNRCGRCHGLKDVTKYTTAQWDGILKSMIRKAKLDDTQAQQVTAYVMANANK